MNGPQTDPRGDSRQPRALWTDSAPSAPRLVTLAKAQNLSAMLVAAAQQQYDQWDESDVDTYAGGGICHLIADAMVGVLSDARIDAASVSSTQEQHVYVVCQLADGVWHLDVPYAYYERGGGYSWAKLPDVRFTIQHLTWYCLSPDPTRFDQFIDD